VLLGIDGRSFSHSYKSKIRVFSLGLNAQPTKTTGRKCVLRHVLFWNTSTRQ